MEWMNEETKKGDGSVGISISSLQMFDDFAHL